MKKILIIIISITLLSSCGGEPEKKSMIKETGEIIDGYADTLEGSVQDARAVKELIEQNQEKLKNNLQSQ